MRHDYLFIFENNVSITLLPKSMSTSNSFSGADLLLFELFDERNAEWTGVRPCSSLILTPNL